MNALERVQRLVAHRMDEIRLHFKSGVKVTVMVRSPEHPDRDFMMTDDDLGELIAMINRRQKHG